MAGGSRLDGPSDRKKDLDKRYDPKGGGTNPFANKTKAKKKSTQNTRVASRVFGDKNSKGS